MTLRTVLLPIAALAATAAVPAHAAYLLQFDQTATGVVAVGRGTLNTTALDELFQKRATVGVSPVSAYAGVGERSLVEVYEFQGRTSTFGSAGITPASGLGDPVAINGVEGQLSVPYNYDGSRTLEGSATFAGATFASLGLTPGTYRYDWGTGVNADSFTVRVSPLAAAGVPEPAAWAMMIGGFGLVGGTLRRRRATVRVRFA